VPSQSIAPARNQEPAAWDASANPAAIRAITRPRAREIEFGERVGSSIRDLRIASHEWGALSKKSALSNKTHRS